MSASGIHYFVVFVMVLEKNYWSHFLYSVVF